MVETLLRHILSGASIVPHRALAASAPQFGLTPTPQTLLAASALRDSNVWRGREDVQALKRLQRDAFEQLLRLDERMDETLAELNTEPDTKPGPGANALRFGGGGGAPGRAGARVSGAVAAGVSLLSFQVAPWVGCWSSAGHWMRAGHCVSCSALLRRAANGSVAAMGT